MPSRRKVLQQIGGTLAGALTVRAGSAAVAVAAEPAPPRIKIGQIGVGHAHASKIEVFRQSPDFEVVGIVEPNDELRKRSAEQDPFRNLTWMSQEQLLNVPLLQAVLVETPVRDLLNVGETCIAAGKHICMDKPAGASLPQYQRLLDAAAERKLLVQMGYMYRYNPGVVMLRDFLKRGWLGEPFEVHTVMSKVTAPDSRRALAEFPGGIMFELGCHIIDLVVDVLGEPAKITSLAQHISPLDDRLQDNMLAIFEYPRALATVKSSGVEVEGFERRHLVVCGTEGTFHIQPLDKPSARVALSAARGKYQRGYQDVALPPYRRYVDDAADMAKIIRGEKAADFSYQHDLIVQTSLLKACGQTPSES